MLHPNSYLMTNSLQSSKPESTSGFVLVLPAVRTECPNIFPTYARTLKKLAVIGEKPGNAEMEEGLPFVGGSGSLLFNAIRRYGINRADCFIGNVSNTPLPEVLKKPWEHAEIKKGAERLRNQLAEHKPICVLIAGGLALEAAFPGEGKKVTDYRGSILRGSPLGICPGVKCVITYNPAYVCRVWSEWALFNHDLERFAHESTTPEITYLARDFELNVSAGRAVELLESITGIAKPVALDIEGGVGGISCISFATSPTKAFIVPLATYNIVDKVRVVRALHRFLASSTPKILQNELYDNFVLSWSYKAPIRNVIWDTMVSGWEIYPELPKGLGTQTSIWTREPYYKGDRKSDVTTTLHEYCCKDSACTYEVYEKHLSVLRSQPAAIRHFRFNMSLLPALLYLEQRGIRYDHAACRRELTVVSGEMLRYQSLIDAHLKAKWVEFGSRGTPPPKVNIGSPKQLMDVLYKRLGLRTMYKKRKRGDESAPKETTDEDALLKLYQITQDDTLLNILQWRKNEKLRQSLETRVDPDGRARCSYNLVGTETGRLSCYKSPTGAGGNFTTITKRLRHIYCADPDHWFFQCDLKGADGWTVSAHSALHGDPTMLDDYLAGLKPAKIVVLMQRHGSEVNTWTRDRLREESKSVNEEGPDGYKYFTAKVIQHGACYGMEADLVCAEIMSRSYKDTGVPLVVKKYEAQRLLDLFFTRYRGVRLWQDWVKRQLDEHSTLPCASGHTRKFFGRRFSKETYGEGYAHEPQHNTTYATNTALRRLWTDPSNRQAHRTAVQHIHYGPSDAQSIGSTSQRPEQSQGTRQYPFRVEPLHHVHDALCGQFHKADTEWACRKLREWFDNPLVIAGQRIVIPFDGAYGPSWGQLGPAYGGGII